MTELYLDIQKNNSCKSILLKDASIYNPDLPITCTQLSVKVPGFTHAHVFEPLPNFEVLANMSNLGIYKHSPLPKIPDGNYEIRYSINPNDRIFVEYNYFSVCQLFEEYIEACLKAYKLEGNLSNKTIDKLFEVSNLMEHAKIAAEECGNADQAATLYKQAQRKLKEINHECM